MRNEQGVTVARRVTENKFGQTHETQIVTKSPDRARASKYTAVQQTTGHGIAIATKPVCHQKHKMGHLQALYLVKVNAFVGAAGAIQMESRVRAQGWWGRAPESLLGPQGHAV